MSISLGKKFEQRFKEDILRLGYFIYRLPDQVTGKKTTSANPCDFFVYCNSVLRMIECKSVRGNTFALSKFTQYDNMKSYMGVNGVVGALIVWFIDKDKVLYIPIETVKMLIDNGKKSININKLDELGENYVDVKSEKKKVFLSSDYSFFELTH